MLDIVSKSITLNAFRAPKELKKPANLKNIVNSFRQAEPYLKPESIMTCFIKSKMLVIPLTRGIPRAQNLVTQSQLNPKTLTFPEFLEFLCRLA
jgi:hypothetical protein